MSKRFAGLVLGLLLASPVLSAFAQNYGFYDVPQGSDYAESISYLRSRGVLGGYPDGSFRPMQTVNRAEFVKIVMLSANKSAPSNCYLQFNDVQAGAWYAPSLCAATSAGIIQGYPDGSFRPLQPVTFAEAAKIVTLAYGENMTEGSLWYENYIRSLSTKKAIPLTVGSINHMMTRGEMAEIMARLEQGITNKPSKTLNDFLGGSSAETDDNDYEDMETYFEYDDDDIDDIADLEFDNDATVDDLYAWDEVAQGIVIARIMTPTEASRLYTALAVAQRDAVVLGTQEADGISSEAIDAVSAEVICRLVPQDCAYVQRLADEDDRDVRELRDIIMKELQDKLNRDTATSYVLPPFNGGQNWFGNDPVTPQAANWDLWFDDSADRLDNPPSIGSSDDEDELDEVRDAVEDVGTDEVAAVHYWAASKGTKSLAGMWMTYVNDALKRERSGLMKAVEVRSVIAMAMTDSYISSFKEAYTFWTARPSQRDSSIIPLIPVPNYPSYPSDHAAVSAAAADLLSEYFPDRSSEFEDLAQEAGDSRVWAGVNFQIDVDEGMDLGHDVSDIAIDWSEDHR